MRLRVADIFATVPDFPTRHHLPAVVAAAFRAILACRTAVLGGHVARCENGHVVRAFYNACRNRSCPRCAYHRTSKWLERQVRTLLGCAHHHLIFTVPHDLNVLWLCNYVLLGELLFRSAQEALFEIAANPRYLGARPGVLMALHTWGQQLPFHPHVHCLATAGGVDEQWHWVPARRKAFLPAEPIKQLFRGKFIDGLRRLGCAGRLRLPDGWGLPDLLRLCRRLEDKRWNVNVRDRYEDPTAVLNYLGRYLHGGPIGESRLLAFDGHTVTFRYKDYRDKGPDGPRQKTLPLDRDEFVRRFLQHVPPKGFHMIRGYGVYRRGGSTDALRRAVRETLPIRPELHAALSARARTLAEPAEIPRTCPICAARVAIFVCPRRAGPLEHAA